MKLRDLLEKKYLSIISQNMTDIGEDQPDSVGYPDGGSANSIQALHGSIKVS